MRRSNYYAVAFAIATSTAVSADSDLVFVHVGNGVAPVPTELVHDPYDPTTDYIVPVALNAVGTPDPVIDLGTSHLAAAMRSRYASDTLTGQPLFERYLWELNGVGVASCEEYVYERWFDYSKFEDATATSGTNYRAIFEASAPLLSDGVDSLRTLVMPRTVVAAPPSGGRQPKNFFFTYDDRYPASDAELHYVWRDPTLPVTIRAGKDWWEHTVAWHQEMNSKLHNRYTDNELEAFAQKQRDFAKLLGRRAELMSLYQSYQAAKSGADTRCAPVHPSSPMERINQIWDPPDFESYFDLHDYYGRDELGARMTTPPPEFNAPPGVGVLEGPQLDFQTQVGAVREQLLADPTSTLGLARVDYLETRAAMPIPGKVVIPPNNVPIDTTGVQEICMQYIDPNTGLPRAHIGNTDACTVSMALGLCMGDFGNQVAKAIAIVDGQIETALERVKPYYCLDLGRTINGQHSASPCDWTPEMFVREMENRYIKDRERDHNACVRSVGFMWSPSDPIHRATTAIIPDKEVIATPERVAAFLPWHLGMPQAPRADYSGSTADVHAFIDMVRDWAVKVLPEMEVGPDGKPIIGRGYNDSSSMGNSEFKVGYGFDAAWTLLDLPTVVGSAGCSTGMEAHASVHADGRAFGWDLGPDGHMFDLEGTVSDKMVGGERRVAATLRFEVFGENIYSDGTELTGETPWFGNGLRFHVAESKSEGHDLPTQTYTTPWGPINVDAGVAGSVGFDFDVTASAETCGGHITGQLKPNVGLEVVASASYGLSGVAEVGVQVGLNLLTLELPFDLAMGIRGAYDGEGYDIGEPLIEADPQLSLHLTTLAGRVRFFASFLTHKEYFDVFSWRGLDLGTVDLFPHKPWKYPLWAIGLRASLVNP